MWNSCAPFAYADRKREVIEGRLLGPYLGASVEQGEDGRVPGVAVADPKKTMSGNRRKSSKPTTFS
jgi:hypothetical protein